jgi:uncharacterized NAD(P)/FAD-binding protein YdhS
MRDHVAIIGGGFSGALLAINLVRHDGPRATLIERRARAGEGVAYGDADQSHLLNVRAGKMSAFPDKPDHFVRWLNRRHHRADAATFVERKVYGEYLRELLDAAVAGAPERLAIVRGTVCDIDIDSAEGCARIALADGASIAADYAVLAVGNLPPHAPPALGETVAGSPSYFGDPWTRDPSHGLSDADQVLILGTGLTMVDMVLKLRSAGFAGRIVALSRRGLTPQAHAEQPPFEPIQERPRGALSRISRDVRARAREIGWRNAVDELRPFTQSIWRAADEKERGRFLRHLRPWWDVRRHRIAPSVAATLGDMIAQGRLTIVAGKCEGFDTVEGGIAATYRPRSRWRHETRVFQRVINCMGPQGDLARTTDPLLQRLTQRGLLRPDAAHLGIDVDVQNRVVDTQGNASDRLLAVGPTTRGAFWEIVAVPDIRVQTWTLARRLSNAYWVGGEGL